MAKYRKVYNLSIFHVLFISVCIFVFLHLNLHYILFQIFLSKPLILVLIPTWLLTFLLNFFDFIGRIKLTKGIKEKTFFYTIFITFLIFYYVFFFQNSTVILAQTACPYQGQPCGSGDCAGTWKTVCVGPTLTCGCQCSSDGRSCTTPPYCAGNKYCTGGSGTCLGGICNTGGTCSCVVGQCGAQCNPNGPPIYDSSCNFCLGYDYCAGYRGCNSDCTLGGCVTPANPSCSCVVGRCGSECCNNDNCPSGYVCNPTNRKCEPAAPPTTTTTTRPSCPSGTTCVDVGICRQAGGSCVSSCGSYECCCSIPTTYTTTTTRTTSSTTTTPTTTFTTTYTTTTTRFTTTTSGGGITTTTRTTTPTPTTTRPLTTTPTTTYTTTTTRFTTTPTVTTTPTTRTTTPILTTTFVTTTRQFTTTLIPTTTIPGACNANGICEPGETQQGCPADCKTIVFTPYKYTANYNPVNLTIQFNDSRIYDNEPIKLEIYFINSTHIIPWNGSDCPIFGKVFNKTNETSIPNTRITYHINVPGLANAITVNTICRVPGLDKLAPGSYTISVKPTIYSPITLSQASTKINIYNNFLEYLLLVIRNLIFG
jgi:hypothetical protein